MKVSLISVGAKMPQWVDQAVELYRKRLPSAWAFTVVPIALGDKSGVAKGEAGVKQAMQLEAQRINAKLKPNQYVIALDSQGQHYSTLQLSQRLACWQSLGQPLALVIGGPHGLAQDCLQRADEIWSLSALTFAHPLVRVIVLEQLYRAWTVHTNHPYHK